MPEQDEPKGLDAKLHAVMSEIGVLKKEGRNEQQGYTYLSEAQIKQAIYPLFVKYKLVPKPQEITILETCKSPSEKQIVTTVKVALEIKDVESGEKEVFTMCGSGADTPGDKGVYKAVTGALKYLYGTLFLIPTGDDPEKVSASQGTIQQPQRVAKKQQDPEVTITEPQQKRMFALMHKSGRTQGDVKTILHKYGYDHSSKVKSKDYDSICAEIEKPVSTMDPLPLMEDEMRRQTDEYDKKRGGR